MYLHLREVLQQFQTFRQLGNKQGDVYYVVSESAGYVWLNDNGTLRWELLGMTVDTSNFLIKTGLLQTTGSSTTNAMSQDATTNAINLKQDVLVSGTNIKTINNQSIVGSGNISLNTDIIISNTEKRIGTFYNGKPLYERTVTITLTKTTGEHEKGDFIASNMKYATIAGVFIDNAGASNNLYNGAGSYTNAIFAEVNPSSANYGYLMGFTKRTDQLNKINYVTVRYTKTTD